MWRIFSILEHSLNTLYCTGGRSTEAAYRYSRNGGGNYREELTAAREIPIATIYCSRCNLTISYTCTAIRLANLASGDCGPKYFLAHVSIHGKAHLISLLSCVAMWWSKCPMNLVKDVMFAFGLSFEPGFSSMENLHFLCTPHKLILSSGVFLILRK